MDAYLKEFHKEEITNLLNDSNECLHVSINLNLTHLRSNRPELFKNLVQNVKVTSPLWDKALLEVQKELAEGNNTFLEPGYQIKENCHVRLVNLAESECRTNDNFPTLSYCNGNIGCFMQVKGTVTRISPNRLLEYKKDYVCSKCRETFTMEALYDKMYVFDIPKKCPNPSGTCKGTLNPKSFLPKREHCMDYQEIRIQKIFSDKNIPATLLITLENDLVDKCQPGDSVTVCGLIERRWKPFVAGKRIEVIICIRAFGISKDDEKSYFYKHYFEQLLSIYMEWEDVIKQMGLFGARDAIIKSISPEISGMHIVKLALALSLCSGTRKNRDVCVDGVTVREHSHVLILGDPGMGKSKLLKAAATISVPSVQTTGLGCSAAGLTAAAVQENGEWQLEAGALVLADGGVCCIDEFNVMQENEKACIHEAMEQQSISMAKAGIVCKLNTRCAIIAAANPKYKNASTSYKEELNSSNIGIGAPLLSRFDIVLLIRDERDSDWDSKIADEILKLSISNEKPKDIWELQRLQLHILAARKITPRITEDVSVILGAYFQFCRSDPYRDPTRTTVRLLNSLNRLVRAHARLTFRDVVEGIDAICIIRLMESSYGFGRLLKSVNVVKGELPLGPNEKEIKEVLRLLHLERMEEAIVKQSKMYNDASYTNKEERVGSVHLKKTLQNNNGNHSRGKNSTTVNTSAKEAPIECETVVIDDDENIPHQEASTSKNTYGYFDDLDDVHFNFDLDIESINAQAVSENTFILDGDKNERNQKKYKMLRI